MQSCVRARIVSRRTLAAVDEGSPAPIPHLPRFHVTSVGRLFVFFYVEATGPVGNAVSENRLQEINRDGSAGPAIRVPLVVPPNMYMTASVRAGSTRSSYLDLLGVAPGKPNTLRYARVRIE